MTIYEIAMSLWAKLPGFHLSLGIAEARSHLEKAVEDGLVVEQNGQYQMAERAA